ncbi:high molecular weight rhoptry protein 3, putative [Plasmodium chabaudi chabaudi]|uniref:High molecular weight rhoptry protein 3, putative n=1 Tax=Plasmodium chabaudi chabaudi TaxID=31271 RepID=A0A1D3LC24_PLACU|nr:high molecular weight rhoptry protein 3, putative [Plasmodium chabaudi chabaudi]
MPTNSLTKLFLASLSTFSVSQVWGKDYFSGALNQNLTDILKCNFISYYNSKPGGPDPNAFLDFVGEPEQFYWFVENYLSVPFTVPQHLSSNSGHNWKSCLKKKWVYEFLKEYEEPEVSYLASVLDKEQRHYYKDTFGDKEPVAKYTIFEVKEFDSYCLLPPFVKTNIRSKNSKENLSFQMDKTDYQTYLEMSDNKYAAMKHLSTNMEYGEKQEIVKAIVESNNENSFQLICPSYYIKIHYNTECKANSNILTCIDDYIKNTCIDAVKNDEDPTICDHLLNLFNSLKDFQIESFQKFLTADELQLTKPRGGWTHPLFHTYSRKDYSNPKMKILPDAFKEFSSENPIFFSFSAEIPEKYSYVDNVSIYFKLRNYSSSSVFDTFQNIFSVFKKKTPAIAPVSVKEVSQDIDNFEFKAPKKPIQCIGVKKSLDLSIDVDIFKVASVEKICSVIDKYALTEDSDFNKVPTEKKMKKLDKLKKGFHIDCILVSTYVEAYNLIRQFLNLENVLSLIRYTSLYTHKFLKSVTTLKEHFLYGQKNAIGYAKSCGSAVLYIPSVMYRRNLYVPETFLSLYLGLSNLVSSNPSSPFFEYSIIDFLITYFNKGTKKFLYYFISIISILHINRYYYEQIYCHHNNHFDTLKSKMIHPDIVKGIMKKLRSILNKPKYSKMMELYKKLESETLFNYDEMAKILFEFDEFAQNKDVQEKAQKTIDEEEKPEVNTLEEMANYNEEWLPKLTRPTIPHDPYDEPNPNIKFDENVRSDGNLTLADRDKELELSLFKYIGSLPADKTASTTEDHTASPTEDHAASTTEDHAGSTTEDHAGSTTESQTDLAFDENVKPTDAEEMKTASKEHLNTLDTEDTNNDERRSSYTNEDDRSEISEPEFQHTAPEFYQDENL